MGLFVLLMLNWQLGGLRFTIPHLNYVVLTTALLLPAFSLLMIRHDRRSYARTAALVGLFPVAGLSLLLFLSAMLLLPFALTWGVTTDRVHKSMPVDGSRIVAYIGSPGAMSSFSIGVYQEWPLLPGLKWAHHLHSLDPANDVRIDVLDRHHVRFTYPDRGDRFYPDDPVVVTVPIH